MSQGLGLLLILSIGVLAVELIYRASTRSARPGPRLVALAAAVGAYMLAPRALQIRGVEESAAIAFCYVAMLLGMIAEYGYAQAERASRMAPGSRRFDFDWLSFLMPVFASPIVFIPLLTLTSELTAGGAFTRAKIMVYLVAFQNGFFWRTFFEQRRAEVAPRRDAAMT